MPLTLKAVVCRIPSVPNPDNAALLTEFFHYKESSGNRARQIKNSLYSPMLFAQHLGASKTFFDVSKKNEIIEFLNTRKKLLEIDPDERWITTWNDYLNRIKHFYRWLYNQHGKEDLTNPAEWETPAFCNIHMLKVKRLSPYTENEIWEKEDILLIIKYATHLRNKFALAFFWDLNARNHEATTVEIRNIKLNESYGEGEIPHNTKTGGGPILLTLSFPYARDWLNIHPFRDNPRSPVICSLKNGARVNPEAMWDMMQSLKGRIRRLLKTGEITDPKERQKLESLLQTKRWNPYCIRHSSITYDSDSLPEFALRKKVRWTMNSKQPGRYVKSRMGNNLKMQILEREGIVLSKEREKPTIRECPRCQLVNAAEYHYCVKCAYPLTGQAFDEMKSKERQKDKELSAVKDQMDVLVKSQQEMFKQLFERGLLRPEK